MVKCEFWQKNEMYAVTNVCKCMSHYVCKCMSITYVDDRTDEYIVLCKFGSHTISGKRVTGVGPPKPPSPPAVSGSPKKPGLNRVHT